MNLKELMMYFLIFASIGCSKREDLFLQDGFKILRIYGDAHSIVTPTGHELVMPNVVKVKDDENFIVGLRSKAEPAPSLPKGVNDQPYGYFIYDKKTKKIILGLTMEDFLNLKAEKGISLHLN